MGLCSHNKKNNLAEDEELARLKENNKSRRCVGLCFILRKKGKKVYSDLVELQKKRPCVGLCYLNKKKLLEKRKKEEEK